MLKTGKTECIHLKYHPIDFKVLSTDLLLILNSVGTKVKNSKFLTLHDENYNLIKKIKEIDGKSIAKISKMAINEEKRELYLLDTSRSRIIVTDFELNFIKYFGSWGNRDDQFFYPNSICFKKGFLYVTDSYSTKKRIKKFNQNFELIILLELEYEPRHLIVVNS